MRNGIAKIGSWSWQKITIMLHACLRRGKKYSAPTIHVANTCMNEAHRETVSLGLDHGAGKKSRSKSLGFAHMPYAVASIRKGNSNPVACRTPHQVLVERRGWALTWTEHAVVFYGVQCTRDVRQNRISCRCVYMQLIPSSGPLPDRPSMQALYAL